MESQKQIDDRIKKVSNQKALRDAAKERRKELLKVIQKIGIKNARAEVKTWAKHYGVAERTIYTDITQIKKRYKPSEMQEIKIDLAIARDQALQQSLDILSKPGKSDEDKLNAIKVLINASKHYREELEAWGEKQKIADKLDVATSNIFNLVEKPVEEIKNDKFANKSKTNGDPESPGR